MSVPLRVLFAEDSEDDARLVLRELERAGYQPTFERVDTPSEMEAALDRHPWDLVIGDYSMPGFSGPAALALLRARDLDTPFIFVSGTIGEDVAVEAMKAGAQDFLTKGNLRRLTPAIDRELRDAAVRRERRRAQTDLLERARLAELSSEVGTALTRGEGLRETLQRCVEALVRHLDVAFARIWTLNDATNTLELQASAGMYTHIDGPHGRVPLGQDKIGVIAEQRRPHLTNQVVGDPDVQDQEWARREGMVAFAGYPLVVHERVVGVMAMFARHALSEFVPKALASVASAVAVGIERKRQEEALRQSEERFAKVFEASPVGITITTLDDARFLDANAAFLRMTGFTREEVLGKRALDLGIWADPMDRSRLIGQLTGGGAARNLSASIRTKDGSTREILVSLERFAVAGTACVLSLVNDVTESRRLEGQLRQGQKMEAVGRLAGGVAHDFNNLLTVITSYSELLLEDLASGDPKRDDVEQIRKAAQGAAALTRQLLAFSRQQVLEPKVLDLRATVAGTEKLLKRLIGEDIALTTSLAPDLGAVKADPGQVEQVIMNLAVNARDAMPTGGRLTIEAANVEMDEAYVGEHAPARPGRYVMLALSDTGIGMDEQTKARIFEPFFTTKEVGKGTGLGLATVYGIVKQAGGFIWVYSEPGHGASFKVYLPRVDEAAAPELARPATRAPGGTETVLLVEDAASVRMVTRQVLERFGYVVLEAPEGDTAMRLATKHHGPIHLLLTDVVMPGISGRELAQQLAPLRPEMKVLYASGYANDAIIQHGILEPGIAYLQKPFTPETLARRVREVLDSGSSP